MKTEIRITGVQTITVEQEKDCTHLAIVTRNDLSVPHAQLNPAQLDDVIQALELCRDSYRRRRTVK